MLENKKFDFPILIAEDNDINRKYLERTLRDAGYEVDSASNGNMALKKFRERFFPIVLTDWMMPEMTGLDLCRIIREQTNKGYVFIVLLTARDDQEDIITGLEAGADDYLVKPINPLELEARLKSWIRILKLERSLRDANEQIKFLTITDPLTGCYNRGYMIEKLSYEIKRARRYFHPFSIIFCDIDHFKRVNDTYGHRAGDLVLIEFSKCIFKEIRSQIDWITRYGGEEFLIALPETEIQGAKLVAERLRQKISQHRIEWEKQTIKLTASFGVTGFDPGIPEERISFDLLIQKADKNMYQSKHEGRNRVTVNSL